MHLTRFTEYTLRTLIYLAIHPAGFVTIAEIARTYGISANHLMKVVQHLAAEGDVITMRGQHGGLRLAREPEAIRIGQVVSRAEPDMELLPRAEIPDGGQPCAIADVMSRARDAFIAVLDEYSIADLADMPSVLPVTFQADTEPAPTA